MSNLLQPARQKNTSLSVRKILRGFGRIILGILAILLVVFAMLPVLLLFVGTGVPALLALALLAADTALIAALLRSKRAPIVIAGFASGIAAVALLAIVASQFFAATPPITDAEGKPLPDSIATLEKVNLNGSEQWITIRGKNRNNPVLLNLGMGGPGGGGFATRTLFTPLEENFVVVSWDEPGTGKSYGAVPMHSLTPERYIADAHALTQLLRVRFQQDKIYVYGVSWTSILGIWLVRQYPELFHAFISTGQMVKTTENDVMGYQLALDDAIQRGDTNTVESLRKNGAPPYTGDGMLGKYVAFLDLLNDHMGEPRYIIAVPIVPFLVPEYGLADKINHTRGLIESFQVVYPQLRDLDFTKQATKLEVPVYFFVGRNDVNAMPSLVQEYFNVLQAPHKELLWLEGGHGLDGSTRDFFADMLVNHVLAQSEDAQ